MKFLVVISLCLLLLMDAVGQKTDPEKARKSFDKARYAFDAGDYESSIKSLQAAIKADSTLSDAYILYGDNLLESGKPEEAVLYYRKSLQFSPTYPEVVWSILGNTLFSMELYPEACPCYDSVLSFPDIRPDLRKTMEEKSALCRFRERLISNPVEFNPVNLGTGVNTKDDEYMNTISADGKVLYFTRREATPDVQGKEYKENLYFSVYNDGTWDTAELLGYPEGTEDDAGALCISPDGNFMVFTSCFRRDGSGSCDLYYSEKIGGIWMPARNMGTHINSDHWDAQPSISPDGNTIYFASNRKGGYGSSDIWAIRRNPDGGWGKPYNLGAVVNTSKADMAPFMHFDGITLFFSSKGHPGLGGADLFRSVYSNKQWNSPLNLGYPINTSADELVVVVNPDGATGFISSNKLEGAGGYDMFSFLLHPDIRPVPVTYLKGVVFDEKNRNPLRAQVELYDLDADSLVAKSMSEAHDGSFLLCLPVGKNYGLHVSCPGYLFYSDHFPLHELKSKADPVIKDIPLSQVRKDNVMILYNIFFETDKYQLQPTSYPELEKLTLFLKNNPGISVEISGHTDDTGAEEYNLELSAKRAQAVVDYLTGQNIGPERLSSTGYGESRPIDTNETPEGKARNRRTEIRITGIE